MNNSSAQPAPVHSSKKHPSSKKWWIILVIVLVVFIGAAATWYFVVYKKPATPVITASSNFSEATKKTIVDAQKLANNGDPLSAKAAYDSAINSSKDSQEKSMLLVNKATISFNEGRYDEALVSANSADSLNASSGIESFIAQIYEAKSDVVNAIKYYKKAITNFDKSQPYSNDDLLYYQSKVDSLSGSNG